MNAITIGIAVALVLLAYGIMLDLISNNGYSLSKILYKSTEKNNTELIRELTDELNSYYDEFEYELTDEQKVILGLKIENTKEVLKGLLA